MLKGIHMGWLYMLVNVLAVVVCYGTNPGYAIGICLVLLAISFTTFCLMYDNPLKRAQGRVTQQLARLSSKGIHAEEHQRLQSVKVTPNDEDRMFRLTPMSGVNIASGIAGGLMLAWGLYARLAT